MKAERPDAPDAAIANWSEPDGFAPAHDSASFVPGDKVSVFDPRLFVDDIKTPLSLTMQPATVLCLYRTNDGWRDLVMDVRFDRDGYESVCHFAWGMKHLTPNR